MIDKHDLSIRERKYTPEPGAPVIEDWNNTAIVILYTLLSFTFTRTFCFVKRGTARPRGSARGVKSAWLIFAMLR